jgi:hypothetical protein
MAEKLGELRAANEALGDPAELQRRIQEEGYLFFKRLQDPDRLLGLRAEILGEMRDGGWLAPGSALMDGVANIDARCTEGDTGYTDVYHQIYRLESFHRAGHWPEVLDVMGKILGGAAVPHPSKIARVWFPQFSEHTTPAHQDFVHFQGTFDTFTCWSPVGDCPVELGGLALLPGSHKKNVVFDHHFSLGAGGLIVDEAEQAGDWLTTDYEVGDSLIFHSLTVHEALPNVTADRMRVSLDNRYQALENPIAEQMLLPHLSIDGEPGWDEIYADWESEELQYYWKKLDITVIPQDTSFGEKGFAEALEQARGGDPRARLHLERIVRRDPTTEPAKEAAKVLAESDGGAD